MSPPEPVLVDHGFQVPIGCGDNLDVDADGPIATHPLKFLLLNSRNNVPPSAARERASLVAEELAFEQLRRDGRAVHLHERPMPTFALNVDGARGRGPCLYRFRLQSTLRRGSGCKKRE